MTHTPALRRLQIFDGDIMVAALYDDGHGIVARRVYQQMAGDRDGVQNVDCCPRIRPHTDFITEKSREKRVLVGYLLDTWVIFFS